MKTIIITILILTVIVMLTLWVRIKIEEFRSTKYLYFKPSSSYSKVHQGEEYESDVHKT
jgi:uncharacterized protein YxeA